MDRVTEDDLLALIEGELPEERKPIVETALRADPALVERVRRMVADREGLRALGKTDKAPSGVVEGALAQADLTRLVQVDTGGPVRAPSLARGSRGRRMQMGVAAVLLIGALGVWVWLMSIVSSSSESTATRDRKVPKIAQLDAGGKGVPASGEPKEPAGPDTSNAVAAAPSVKEAMQAIGAPQEEEQTDDTLLNEWLANLDSGSGPEGAARLMEWSHAAQLALAGKLRINVAGEGPFGVALADSGAGLEALRRYQVLHKASGVDEGWRVELSFESGQAQADLAGELERTVHELQMRMGRRVWVSEAEGIDEEAGPAPASDVDSVLWWGAGPGDWTRRMSIRLPVDFVAK